MKLKRFAENIPDLTKRENYSKRRLTTKLTKTLISLQGSLEDQLHRLKEYEAGVYAYKPHIEELERIHQAVQEGMIFENRYLLTVLHLAARL